MSESGGEERPYGGRPSPIGRRQRSRRRQPDAAAGLCAPNYPLCHEREKLSSCGAKSSSSGPELTVNGAGAKGARSFVLVSTLFESL